MTDLPSATAAETRQASPRSKRASVRYAWALLPFTCGAAISTLLFRMATDGELWARWSQWFPFALRPVFHDLSITLDHLREAGLGLDPLSDPESEFAYPRPVLLLRYLGVHHIPTEWVGLLQGLLFTLAVIWVLRPFTPLRAVATSLLFFSPPLLLGFERGNLDLPLFALCAFAAWQWARPGPRHLLVWPVAAAVVGALLKLYPLFALFGGALADTRRRRVFWLGGIAAVLGYWVLNAAELELIINKVPVWTGAAWGSLVFFARVERWLIGNGDELAWLGTLNWSLIAIAVYVAAAGVAALLGFRLAPRFASVPIPRREWTAYWIGALICLGSFVGSNLAYRWVFVLLTLPLLLRAMRANDPLVALWGRTTVAVVLLSLWSPLETDGGLFAVVQVINWTCILAFVIGCVGLRVTAKSPIFAFFLRLCAAPPAPFVAPDVEGASASSR